VPTFIDGDFEWDSEKAAKNLEKHTFEEAMTALEDPMAVDIADTLMPGRVVTLGISARLRVLCVVTTERGERTRIISARKATRHEQRIYEEC
jgi:uncharacterized DUF497 family protein